MKVLIFGNVGSGKTTIVNKLVELYPFEIIAIDDFRRKYGNGTMEKEVVARDNFLLAVSKQENQFVECLGVGIVADKLFELLSVTNEMIVCIVVNASKNVCLSRLSGRIWNVPFPYSIDKVNSLIDRTDAKIAANEIECSWRKREKTIIFKKNNESLKDLENIIVETNIIIQNLIKYERNRINAK